MGSDFPLTAELSTVTFITSSISGNSNIVFSNIFSNIDLKPLAPVFFEIAFFAISEIASSLNSNSTFSNSKSLFYCLINEFFGSLRIFTKEFSSRSSKVAMIGILPINSGINPYFIKSSGSSNFIIFESGCSL